MAKPALGRGLGALLGGVSSPAKAASTAVPATPPTPSPAPAQEKQDHERVQRVALKRIIPCPFQPRKDFSPESLQELADSIKAQGIVQPLIVRPKGDDFELIAGERRWRAAQMLGLLEAPIIIREADDRAVLELALIENLQRENLNPLEEAQGYEQLILQFSLTQEQVAAKVGKSRAVVANALRLLKLPKELQQYLRDGQLSVGHAKVILGLNRPEDQKTAVDRVLKEALNVRQTESLVAEMLSNAPSPSKPRAGKNVIPLPKDAHVQDIQNKLQERLGTKVQLRYLHGKGSIDIRFFTDDDLERVLQLLGIQLD